jgi:hypothetical protein
VLIASSYSPTGIIAAYSLVRSSSQRLINKKKQLKAVTQHSLRRPLHVIRVALQIYQRLTRKTFCAASKHTCG